MRIKAEGGYMEDHVTKRRIPIPKGSVFTIDIQDVNNMPVFCMTRGTLEECVNYVSDKEYTIKFSKTYEDEVRHSLIAPLPFSIVKRFKNPSSLHPLN